MSEGKWIPGYHFKPLRNWMNDPNGLMELNGEIHLFYQYNPNGAFWGDMHWGHATSRDMVHWLHKPVALAPAVDRGETHCFSGCAVKTESGEPLLLYTSIGEGLRNPTVGAEQWAARSLDGGTTFTQIAENPILDQSVHGDMKITEWRDPFVWREADEWRMVVGGSLSGHGCVLLYHSTDLLHWTYVGIFYEDTRYAIIECPNVLKFEDTYVLVFSPSVEVQVRIGKIGPDGRLVETAPGGTLDGGGWQGYYAPQTLKREDGRYVQWGWMPEGSRGDKPENTTAGAAGDEARTFDWSGVQSVPRILSLDDAGGLVIAPAVEMEALRGPQVFIRGFELETQGHPLPAGGEQVEILADFHLSKDAVIDLAVLAGQNGEETVIRYDAAESLLQILLAQSSLDPLTDKRTVSVRHALEEDGHLQLHVFVDVSCVEVFADHAACLSARTYPTGHEAGLGLRKASGGRAQAEAIRIWPLSGIRD